MENRESELDRVFGQEEGKEQARGEAQTMIRQTGMGDRAWQSLIESLDKSKLMEFLMRTVFASREELLIFNDYVSWCEDFGIPLDNARRYVAARPAVAGLARKELVEALNTFRWIDSDYGRKGKTPDKDKRKLPE